MTEQVQLALIAALVPTLTAVGVLYVAIQTRREVGAQAAETAAVKAGQEHVAEKVTAISKATDGVNTALTASAREAADTIRRLELIIAGFSAQQALATEPHVVEVTNGRAHDLPAEPEPIAVYTAPGSTVEVAAAEESPLPVETVRKAAKAGKE